MSRRLGSADSFTVLLVDIVCTILIYFVIIYVSLCFVLKGFWLLDSCVYSVGSRLMQIRSAQVKRSADGRVVERKLHVRRWSQSVGLSRHFLRQISELS